MACETYTGCGFSVPVLISFPPSHQQSHLKLLCPQMEVLAQLTEEHDYEDPVFVIHMKV